ncbi:MAG: phasin family protein [Synechococcus sp.]
MASLGKLVQKAFYLGMGVASVAADRAGTELGELRQQAQKLADELVERGEMTTQDARDFVDTFVKQQMKQAESAISNATVSTDPSDTNPARQTDSSQNQPRKIQIDEASTQIVNTTASDSSKTTNTAPQPNLPATSKQEALRQEIDALKAELDRLRNS